ncbi:hypothetical protein CPAV1605_250 [seawater metagenome]|uniref:TLC domain-containing protein n=1 Tax=seawater metagenome TaxID=1561972 RepID=A0A5E8CL07_9ZZZZ
MYIINFIYSSFLQMILLSLLGLLFVDILIYFTHKNYSRKTHWFLLHSIMNICTFYSIIPDIFYSLYNWNQILSIEPDNWWGYAIVIAGHIYHCLAYELNSADIFHHVTMFVFAVPYTLIYQPYLMSNLPILTINGIPGAIDYFLLYLVKIGKINSDMEKYINVHLNIWFRCPISLLIVGGTIPVLIQLQKWESIPCMLAIAWNSIYFQYITVRDVYYKFGLVDGKIIKP